MYPVEAAQTDSGELIKEWSDFKEPPYILLSRDSMTTYNATKNEMHELVLNHMYYVTATAIAEWEGRWNIGAIGITGFGSFGADTKVFTSLFNKFAQRDKRLRTFRSIIYRH